MFLLVKPTGHRRGVNPEAVCPSVGGARLKFCGFRPHFKRAAFVDLRQLFLMVQDAAAAPVRTPLCYHSAGPNVSPMNLKTLLYVITTAMVVGCAHVPGETLTSGGLQRDVKARVLSLATANKPACKASVVNTEVVELHGDGKVAVERWTVERCGERINYRINLPPTRGGEKFTVTAEP